MADDLEVVFGDRIVRLDGTVVECFGLSGFFTGTRIPVNFLGVTMKREAQRRSRDRPRVAGIALRRHFVPGRARRPSQSAGAGRDFELSETQWPKLQPLLIEAAKRRTPADT